MFNKVLQILFKIDKLDELNMKFRMAKVANEQFMTFAGLGMLENNILFTIIILNYDLQAYDRLQSLYILNLSPYLTFILIKAFKVLSST